MFTGIVKGIGEVSSYDSDAFILRIKSPLFTSETALLGKSIAIDGVCLTVSHLEDLCDGIVGFDLGAETRRVTLLTKIATGDLVNIEFGLAAGDPLDGHLVQGHVDAIARIDEVKTLSDGHLIRFSKNEELMKFIVKKGSVAINGVSLTVNETTENGFEVFIVPHTLSHTTFKSFRAGDLVHVETDIFGRYLHHFFKISLREGFSNHEHGDNTVS